MRAFCSRPQALLVAAGVAGIADILAAEESVVEGVVTIFCFLQSYPWVVLDAVDIAGTPVAAEFGKSLFLPD